MESLFEKLGGTYTLAEDGMYYPEIASPKIVPPRYGKYGRMRLLYLQGHRLSVYHDFILQDKLRWKVMAQVAPFATIVHKIQHGIHQFPLFPFAPVSRAW